MGVRCYKKQYTKDRYSHQKRRGLWFQHESMRTCISFEVLELWGEHIYCHFKRVHHSEEVKSSVLCKYMKDNRSLFFHQTEASCFNNGLS